MVLYKDSLENWHSHPYSLKGAITAPLVGFYNAALALLLSRKFSVIVNIDGLPITPRVH